MLKGCPILVESEIFLRLLKSCKIVEPESSASLFEYCKNTVSYRESTFVVNLVKMESYWNSKALYTT